MNSDLSVPAPCPTDEESKQRFLKVCRETGIQVNEPFIRNLEKAMENPRIHTITVLAPAS